MEKLDKISKKCNFKKPVFKRNLKPALRKKIYSAEVFYRLGMLKEAKRKFREIIKEDPLNSEAHFYQGLIYEEEGKENKAIREFELSLQNNSKIAFTHFLLGNLYQRKELYEKALSSYINAIELAPGVPVIYNNLGWLFFKTGDIEKAVCSFHEALGIDPHVPYPYYGLGSIYFELELWEEAMLEFQEAVTVSPTYLQAYLKLGQVYRKLEMNQDAVIEIEKVIRLDKSGRYLVSAHTELAEIYAKSGCITEAIKHWEQVAKTQPSLAVYKNLSWLYLENNSYRKALKAYRHYLKLAPSVEETIYYDIARVYYHLNDYSQALAYCQKVIGIEPHHAPTHQLLGKIYLLQDNFDKGVYHYELAAKLKGDPSSWCEVGHCFEVNKQYESAKEYYQKAIHLEPQSALPYYHLGKLFAEEKKFLEALVVLEHAADLDSCLPNILQDLKEISLLALDKQ